MLSFSRENLQAFVYWFVGSSCGIATRLLSPSVRQYSNYFDKTHRRAILPIGFGHDASVQRLAMIGCDG